MPPLGRVLVLAAVAGIGVVLCRRCRRRTRAQTVAEGTAEAQSRKSAATLLLTITLSRDDTAEHQLLLLLMVMF